MFRTTADPISCVRLTSGEYPNTDHVLFDRFADVALKVLRRKQVREDVLQLDLARLYLSHPTRRDAGPALNFISEHFQSKPLQDAQKALPTSVKIKQRLTAFFADAATVAREIGRPDDADHVQAYAAALLGAETQGVRVRRDYGPRRSFLQA